MWPKKDKYDKIMVEIKKGDGLVKLLRSGDFNAWQFKMQLHHRGLGICSIVDSSEPAVLNPVTLKPENNSDEEDRGPVPTPAINKQALHKWHNY